MASEKFLVVDDAEENLLFFQVVLKEMGITEVMTATNGHDALKKAEAEKVKFVIIAWEMSPMPGTVFVQKFTEPAKRKHIPCLIYSKKMSTDEVKLTQDLGLKDILGMPFDRAKVKEIITLMKEREESLSPIELTLRKIEDYMEERRAHDALTLFNDNKLMSKGPHLPRAKTLMADVYMEINKSEKSEALLKEALGQDEHYLPALRLLAKLYSKQGKHEESIKILETLTEESPKNLASKVSLGCAYVDADKHDKAREVLSDVLDLDESSRGAKDEMGKLAFKEGDISLAAKFLAETKNGTELARDFNNMAIAFVAQGQHDKGIEIYHNALKVLSDKAKLHLLYYNLGLAWRKKGDLNLAFKELSTSFLSEPTYEKAYSSLAKVVKEMKEKNMPLDNATIQKVRQARTDNPPPATPPKED